MSILKTIADSAGWCWDGHLAKMCNFADMDYARMLEAILDAAAKRIDREYASVK